MVTTAARSRDFLRKLNYIAEVCEHRRTSFIRVDLFGVADVIAVGHGEIILVQAYHKSAAKDHLHINAKHPFIKKWIECGGKFELHEWHYTTKKGRKKWAVERIIIN